jgi:hypothetical protein
VRTQSATGKLRTIILFHLHCVLDEVEGSAAHLLTNSISRRLQKRLLAKRDRYEHGTRRLIAAGIRSGQFLHTDPALAARAILGTLNSTIAWFNSQGPLSTEQLAENFATYLIRGLCRRRALARPTVAVSAAQSPRRVRGKSANLNSGRSRTVSTKLAKKGSRQW